MQFEWDEGKDAANRAKHGVSLGDAVQLDWDDGVPLPDLRRDYGEARIKLLAMMGTRVHVCIYSLRGDAIRVISLRKASAREVRQYASAK